MPKLKTNRAAAKRFKVTKNGVIKRHKAGLSHILASKTRKMKRRLRRPDTVNKADYPNIKKLIPYSF